MQDTSKPNTTKSSSPSKLSSLGSKFGIGRKNSAARVLPDQSGAQSTTNAGEKVVTNENIQASKPKRKVEGEVPEWKRKRAEEEQRQKEKKEQEEKARREKVAQLEVFCFIFSSSQIFLSKNLKSNEQADKMKKAAAAAMIGRQINIKKAEDSRETKPSEDRQNSQMKEDKKEKETIDDNKQDLPVNETKNEKETIDNKDLQTKEEQKEKETNVDSNQNPANTSEESAPPLPSKPTRSVSAPRQNNRVETNAEKQESAPPPLKPKSAKSAKSATRASVGPCAACASVVFEREQVLHTDQRKFHRTCYR